MLHPATVRVTVIAEYKATSPVCPFTLSTPVFEIALFNVITQVVAPQRLSFWTLLRSYGLELLVMNVLEL